MENQQKPEDWYQWYTNRLSQSVNRLLESTRRKEIEEQNAALLERAILIEAKASKKQSCTLKILEIVQYEAYKTLDIVINTVHT